jgi:hypothetical protein
MSIPIEHVRNLLQYTENGEYLTIAKFKSNKDIYFDVRIVRRTETFSLHVCYDRYRYDCGRKYNVVKFFSNYKDTQEDQLSSIFKSFLAWKHNMNSDDYHMLNDRLIPRSMYQTLLFTNSFINEEESEICYICHEPCLFYETIGECGHKIHRFCAVQMTQKNGPKTFCGICKTLIAKPICSSCAESDDEDYEYD